MSKDTYNEYFTDVSQGGKYFQLTFYTNEKEKFLAMETLARKCIAADLDVDVVEVVRCKDCKYNETTIKETGAILCRKHVAALYMGNDHYCSYGERREK